MLEREKHMNLDCLANPIAILSLFSNVSQFLVDFLNRRGKYLRGGPPI